MGMQVELNFAELRTRSEVEASANGVEDVVKLDRVPSAALHFIASTYSRLLWDAVRLHVEFTENGSLTGVLSAVLTPAKAACGHDLLGFASHGPSGPHLKSMEHVHDACA